jgi:hypothetical protein
MKVLLLVTWIVNGAANSYQVEFDGPEKCDFARHALINDRNRFVANTVAPLNFQVPQVSAVCVTH